MSRTIIVYGDRVYTVSDRTPDELREHLTASLADGAPFWLTVNATEGRFTRAQLLVTTNTALAILDDDNAGQRPRFDTEVSNTDDTDY
ncbi:hypothetical protein [Curtobacterium sp. ISL-83]|uniref:hypothetical protein n=1 Tax=Curtobacterium sp. ISL-83 TaxID=2819145 RepID=UPI001BEC91DB|nr:hypothetical protein [Curtobacterium sp. ISL-83]MBT2502222.1 hypothetical protein [Curtobacterium sp. ISL-83]